MLTPREEEYLRLLRNVRKAERQVEEANRELDAHLAKYGSDVVSDELVALTLASACAP